MSSNKILMPQLISMLAAATGRPKKQAEAFLKSYFTVVSDALEGHESVRIKDFGSFKISRVEARKSVNVSTGEEVNIPPHFKIVFTPSKQMADKVNKEFSWLEIVEVADKVTNDDLEQAEKKDNTRGHGKKTAEQGGVVEKEEGQSRIAAMLKDAPTTAKEINEPRHLTREQEEESEHLGEELEEDFGIPEPSEPFGPIDPDDPEPGEPIPENSDSKPQITISKSGARPVNKVRETVAEPVIATVPEQVSQSIVPVSVSEVTDETVRIDPPQESMDFDPYAENSSAEEIEPTEPQIEPFYVTKDEIENYATKADFKMLARNIKKLKTSVDEANEYSKERSKRAVIWSLILCAALFIGGFFLTYYLLLNRFSGRMTPEPTATEKTLKETMDEEDSPASIAHLTSDSNSDETAGTPEVKVEAEELPEENTPAPTSPSDVKAMDKVTTTRYLTTMAKEHYGNYNLWPYIYIENEGKLGHPDRIRPGTVVVIPNIQKYNIDPSNPKDIDKARKLGVEIYKKHATN